MWGEHLAGIKEAEDTSPVGLKEMAHWYPEFYFGGPATQIDELDDLRRDLSRAFAELGRRLCINILEWQDSRTLKPEPLFPIPEVREPARKGEKFGARVDYPCNKDGSPSHDDETGMINTRNLELLRTLWDATARFTHLAYLGGLQDGKNLLVQMAHGELSPQDFQARDIEIAKEMQSARYLHQQLSSRRAVARSGSRK
jgi:hypothetical protein